MSRLPALAMLINPRYKDACYMEKSEKQWASKLLTTAAEELAEYHLPPDCPSERGACLTKTPEDSMWHTFQNFHSETDWESGCSVADIVANYLKTPFFLGLQTLWPGGAKREASCTQYWLELLAGTCQFL